MISDLLVLVARQNISGILVPVAVLTANKLFQVVLFCIRGAIVHVHVCSNELSQ